MNWNWRRKQLLGFSQTLACQSENCEICCFSFCISLFFDAPWKVFGGQCSSIFLQINQSKTKCPGQSFRFCKVLRQITSGTLRLLLLYRRWAMRWSIDLSDWWYLHKGRAYLTIDLRSTRFLMGASPGTNLVSFIVEILSVQKLAWNRWH